MRSLPSHRTSTTSTLSRRRTPREGSAWCRSEAVTCRVVRSHASTASATLDSAKLSPWLSLERYNIWHILFSFTMIKIIFHHHIPWYLHTTFCYYTVSYNRILGTMLIVLGVPQCVFAINKCSVVLNSLKGKQVICLIM